MKAIAVVLVCKGLLRVRGQTWVVHFCDLRMLLQVLRDGLGVRTLLLHPERHGLRGLQDHEGRERIYDVTMDILHPFHLLCEFCILRDDGAPRHHVVTLVVLCQTLDAHVRTMVQGAQDHGRREGGVDMCIQSLTKYYE